MEEFGSKKRMAKVGVGILGIVLLGLVIFYAGMYVGSANPKEIKVVGVADTTGKEGGNINFNLFWEAWDIVKDKHLEGEKITNQDLLYGSIMGLVGAFNDPYSVFLPPEDSQKFQEDVGGNFGGVGMEIEVKERRLMVVAPLAGTPAAEAGIRAGDYIAEIDGEPTEGLSVDEAVKKIRGEIGTTVKLTVSRSAWPEPKEISIKRANIQVPTLEWEMKGDVAYVKLMSFNNNTIPLFYEAMIKSLFSGAKGMVLDLRDNPGGFLEVATRMTGWFVKNGEVVVSEEFRSGERNEFRAAGNEALVNFPVVVLVNKGSASAAEILAGVLRDLKEAPLVGETTFGKGTVQELEALSDGSLIKVTVGHWVLPSGKIIGKEGITPDVEVKITEDDIAAKRDPQLEKALSILEKKIAGD